MVDKINSDKNVGVNTKRKPKKLRSRNIRKAKQLFDPEAEKHYAKTLLKMLMLAERHGVIRYVLESTGDAFRKLEAQKVGRYGLPPEYLSPRRTLVANYVTSLVRQLDAFTLAEIIIDLLCELRIRGTKSGRAWATEAGISREPDELASRAIVSLIRTVQWLFCEFVKEEDQKCAIDFALCTTQFVETLSELARESPEVLRGIASEMIAWPIMATRHYPKRSDFAKLANRIGLATKSPVTPRERHKWKPDTALNRYLLDLIVNAGWGDGRPLTKETLRYYLNEVLMPLFDRVAKELGGWENYPEFSAIAQSAAKRGKAGVQRSEIRNRTGKALKAFSA